MRHCGGRCVEPHPCRASSRICAPRMPSPTAHTHLVAQHVLRRRQALVARSVHGGVAHRRRGGGDALSHSRAPPADGPRGSPAKAAAGEAAGRQRRAGGGAGLQAAAEAAHAAAQQPFGHHFGGPDLQRVVREHGFKTRRETAAVAAKAWGCRERLRRAARHACTLPLGQARCRPGCALLRRGRGPAPTPKHQPPGPLPASSPSVAGCRRGASQCARLHSRVGTRQGQRGASFDLRDTGRATRVAAGRRHATREPHRHHSAPLGYFSGCRILAMARAWRSRVARSLPPACTWVRRGPVTRPGKTGDAGSFVLSAKEKRQARGRVALARAAAILAACARRRAVRAPPCEAEPETCSNLVD